MQGDLWAWVDGLSPQRKHQHEPLLSYLVVVATGESIAFPNVQPVEKILHLLF